jgi:hypothetical protein
MTLPKPARPSPAAQGPDILLLVREAAVLEALGAALQGLHLRPEKAPDLESALARARSLPLRLAVLEPWEQEEPLRCVDALRRAARRELPVLLLTPGELRTAGSLLPGRCVHLPADTAPARLRQALLDLLTVWEAKRKKDDEPARDTLSGLKVAIVGDIAHSRVARSDIHAFTKMGAQVTVAGPATMLPPHLETLGAEVTTSLIEAVRGADVIMMLRLQLERMGQMFMSTLREYSQFFGLAPRHLKLAKDDVIIMHPGPLNRGVEISPEVADGPHSLILEQVTNGVAVRMAVLYFLIGGEKG